MLPEASVWSYSVRPQTSLYLHFIVDMRIRHSQYVLIALQQSLRDTNACYIEGVGTGECSDTTDYGIRKCVERSEGEVGTVRVLGGGEVSRGRLLKKYETCVANELGNQDYIGVPVRTPHSCTIVKI